MLFEEGWDDLACFCDCFGSVDNSALYKLLSPITSHLCRSCFRLLRVIIIPGGFQEPWTRGTEEHSGRGGDGLRLDLMVLEVFSNLNNISTNLLTVRISWALSVLFLALRHSCGYSGFQPPILDGWYLFLRVDNPLLWGSLKTQTEVVRSDAD